MKYGLIVSALLVCGFVLALDSNLFSGEKDKITIKQVMQKAHGAKKGEMTLLKKVQGGTASEEEKKSLAELYAALPKNDPPMGEKDAWVKLTTTLAEAAKKGDLDVLKKVDCGGCHKEFKKKKGT